MALRPRLSTGLPFRWKDYAERHCTEQGIGFTPTDLFFRHPAYESVWTRTWINQYSPVGNPDDARLTFNITPTSPGNYMNLSDAFIALELGIVDKDGKAPTTDDSVSIINSFTHSIFKVLV